MLKIIGAPLRWTRQLYDWVLKFSKSPRSQTALFLLSMAEASFFPIAPDALLIALCVGSHRRWMRFALVCSAGSVVGGILGYLIGYAAFDLIGHSMLAFVGAISGTSPESLLDNANIWFNQKELYGVKVGAWAVGAAGFTPIPYKVFTIAAGFFKMSFPIFLVASVLSRSARFFMVAGIVGMLFERYGVRIQQFIDKYFNLLAILFLVLLIAGFGAIRLMAGQSQP